MRITFEPIDFDHLSRYSSWDVVQSLSPYNIYVNDKGQAISGFYNGRAYFLVSELEKTFTLVERVSRVVCGLLTVLCSLFLLVALSSTRDFFSAQRERIRIGLLAHNPNPDRTIKGISTQLNILQTIDAACLDRQSCRISECQGEHPCVHMCSFKNEQGTLFQKKLNSIEIRDILEWSPGVQNINKRHFTSRDKSICMENIPRTLRSEIRDFS